MNTIYYHHNTPYTLKRKILVHKFEKNGTIVLDLVKNCRNWFDCDHVLRDQTHFLFVETLEEPEIITGEPG